jgi:hypothetical protein
MTQCRVVVIVNTTLTDRCVSPQVFRAIAAGLEKERMKDNE